MDIVTQHETKISTVLRNDKPHVFHQLLTERTRKQTNCVRTLI